MTRATTENTVPSVGDPLLLRSPWPSLDALVQRHRARLADAAYLAVGLLATLALASYRLGQGDEVEALWHAVANSAVTLSLLWRRRYPRAVAAAGVTLCVVADGDVVMALTLFALAIRRRDGWLVAAAVAGAAAMAATVPLDDTSIGPAIVSAVLFVGAAGGLGAFLGARRDLIDSLQERAVRAEAEQHLRADQARLAERARIAREMHDVVAHKLSLVVLHAGGLEVRPDAGPEQIERSAALIRTTARDALDDLREVLGVLRTDTSAGMALAPQPRLDDIPTLVQASVDAGMPVTLRADHAPGPSVPEAVGRTAYRVVQEALTNVHKHAPGTETEVRLGGGPGSALVVEVRNRLRAGSRQEPLLPGARMGLVGLEERVRLAGGEFRAGVDHRDDAFVVRASLPWPEGGPAGPTGGPDVMPGSGREGQRA